MSRSFTPSEAKVIDKLVDIFGDIKRLSEPEKETIRIGLLALINEVLPNMDNKEYKEKFSWVV